MKSRWSIRGNLMLINMVVISLILWLTISFLYVAIAQRGQAVQLYNNIQVDKAVLNVSKAIISERSSLRIKLLSADAMSHSELESLSTRADGITMLFDEMVQTIDIESATNSFFRNTATTKASTVERLHKLDFHYSRLQDNRAQAHSQLLLPLEQRDSEVTLKVFNEQTVVLESLVHLFRGLKYLPDSDASMVSKFHSLLNETIVVSSNISLKNAMLSELLVSSEPPGSDLLSQIGILNSAIERQLDDIVMIADSCTGYDELQVLAFDLRDVHDAIRSQSERNIKNLWQQPDHDGISIGEWNSITGSLRGSLDKLSISTHEALEHLASINKSRATRNVFIDVLLAASCLFIALGSIVLSGRIRRLAFHDNLTGLPNRMNFESALMANTDSSTQGVHQHAVIFIDLDRFKSINDTFGHAIGDKFLKEIARRLIKSCSSGEMVARLGGDEFGVFISNVDSEEQVESRALRLVESIVADIKIDELSLKAGASAGISISPHDCECGPELLRNADIAMYHSKNKKLGGVYRFNQTIAGNYHKRIKLELDLKRGLESNELRVFYQPKVCTVTNKVKGVEALLRWEHPERGFVSPVEFIPIAEETGLMSAIGAWVMNEACRELAELEKKHDLGIHVAVNISAQQFNDERFSETVYEAISRHGLANDKLELEITESLVMHDISRVINMLKGLQESGIKIAIDDFGTGYSSLQYLQELPLNTLKIDRAFIVALKDSDPDSSVANSIVQLAKLFNLETVAEGVETDNQDARVRALGVSQIQGYRYSKPIPSDLLPGVIATINALSNDDDNASSKAA